MKIDNKVNQPLLFSKMNYKLTLASIALMAIGFILMIGDTDIYSTMKITIAPLIIFAGILLAFVAIFYKEKAK
jgi:glucan phosphoethanolaminetransferase (alkaline phosphatase superfamily)